MGDAQAERKQKDDAVRTTIMQKLVETGEKERLKELLRQKLVECGWRDELKEYCKEVIRSKGLEKITVDELVAEITPRGRATVPDEVKTELLQSIRKFLQVCASFLRFARDAAAPRRRREGCVFRGAVGGVRRRARRRGLTAPF
mmetsp:Transcript_15911/g.51786  ORF Transcript_15911/g.51786 Transcript_15911/m.51786 type:complete len:144 (+) Transcript_15911:52-483(+)